MRNGLLFLAGTLLVVAVLTVVLIMLVSQPLVRKAAVEPVQVDEGRLKAHVHFLTRDAFPRSYDRPANLDLAARYVSAAFEAAGAQVTTQENVVRGVTYRNVIARFGPTTGPLMVIGAHYDSNADVFVSRSSAVSDETHTPGADDNASGVAGLLELARLLGQKRPARSIELVAYTLEEAPHFKTGDMGSIWHARSLAAAGRDVKLMLSLEMIGFFRDEPGSQAYPFPGMEHLYSKQGDFIALAGQFGNFVSMRRAKSLMAGAASLPVYSINAPAIVRGIDFSDHSSYWAEGFPALMITDTAFYRNPHYHRASDTAETLDYRRMADVVKGVYSIAMHY